MQNPVIDLGSNLQANLKRWARFLRGGGAKLSVFNVIYSGKRKTWTAKEIADALHGTVSAKAVTMAGKKLDGEGLIRQVPDKWPVAYEKLPNVHHYKQSILSLLKQEKGKPKKTKSQSLSDEGRSPKATQKLNVKKKKEHNMHEKEIEQGKKIVERLIVDLCNESGVRLTKPIDWHHDFDRMLHWLSLEIDGAEKKWSLSDEALTDSVDDKNVRRKIEQNLRMYVIPAPAPQKHSPPSKEKTVLVSNPEYDVFVSHATEDKDFVGPLVEALKAANITVWYDNDVMTWGDDLRSSIDRGLIKSRFGIVVFSKAFLRGKQWTEHELSGLFAREKPGQKVILPIRHNITRDDLAQYSPSFVGRIAMNSEKDSVADIVRNLKSLLGKS
jgi:hypothetical protein